VSLYWRACFCVNEIVSSHVQKVSSSENIKVTSEAQINAYFALSDVQKEYRLYTVCFYASTKALSSCE